MAEFADVVRGRCAWAIVSLRSGACPRKSCRRQRHCLGAGRVYEDFEKPTGDCPNMTRAEWRIVSLGIRTNLTLLGDMLERWKSGRAAEAERRVRGRRKRRSREADAIAVPAADKQGLAPLRPYWLLLWLEIKDSKVVPPDLHADLAQCRNLQTGRGCTCWKERRLRDCGTWARADLRG